MNLIKRFDDNLILNVTLKSFFQARISNISVDFEQHKKYVKLSIWCTVAISATLAIATPLFAYHQNIPTGFVLLPSCVYQLLHSCFYTSQFSLATLAVKERFKLINKYFFGVEKSFQMRRVDHFLNSSNKTSKQQSKIYPAYRDHSELKLFSELYSDLCDLIEIINSTFTIQIVFVLTSLIVTNIFSAYSALRELRQPSHMFYFSVVANTA